MAVILLLLSLQGAPGATVAPAVSGAPRITRTGTLPSRMSESSGIVVSRTHRGVLWTHNDSGDGPYLYATDLAGTDRGTVRVRGARAVDWEDIALGPCPTAPGACLYIADTGDNAEKRKAVVVYALPEPELPAGAADTVQSRAATALRLKYPGGPQDVEAVYVSPHDSALYLVNKARRGPVRLYQVPRSAWRGDNVVTATAVQQLPISPAPARGRLVTGAAMRRDGQLVAIRTYSEIHFFVPAAAGRLTPSPRPACTLAGLEPQGEAIAFLDDGTLVVTSEAAAKQRGGPIHTVRCPT